MVSYIWDALIPRPHFLKKIALRLHMNALRPLTQTF